jgi:hypothetical protein
MSAGWGLKPSTLAAVSCGVRFLSVNWLPWKWLGAELMVGERAAEAGFGIGEGS